MRSYFAAFSLGVMSKAYSAAASLVSSCPLPSNGTLPITDTCVPATASNYVMACINAEQTTNQTVVDECVADCSGCCPSNGTLKNILKSVGFEGERVLKAIKDQATVYVQCGGPQPDAKGGEKTSWSQPDFIVYIATGTACLVGAAAAFRNMWKNGRPDVYNGGAFAVTTVTGTAAFSLAVELAAAAGGSALVVSGLGVAIAAGGGLLGAGHMFYKHCHPGREPEEGAPLNGPPAVVNNNYCSIQ